MLDNCTCTNQKGKTYKKTIDNWKNKVVPKANITPKAKVAPKKNVTLLKNKKAPVIKNNTKTKIN